MVEESMADYAHMRRCDISALYFYYAHSLFVKLSVLVFYRRVFGVSRLNKFWIYVIGGAQTALFVGFCIFQGFQCIPLAKYFNITVPGHCTDEWLIVLTFECPNSLLDYAVVILAIFIIQPLHLSPTVKWKLRFLFGLGFLTGTLGFIKIAITYSKSKLYPLNMVSLWTSVQMFVSLLCCCLPMYNVFLPGLVAFWSRLSSRMVSYATFGRVSRFNSGSKSSTDSSRRSGYGNQGQDWVHLGDDNSSKGFAWAEAAPFAEAHALGELAPHGRANPEASGIHVHRQFDVA
ncbi:hypothetical protein UA08_05551 [Talaromyces atroroseus]|uniref:Rhodopsin domain-containing protein n=1 Tax=Talaromyces atroroseus TaxID=1441469 RepID=A0A225AT57_TALAT|nr:hypothetical protein UA08_05551 [Talaromyces atroroseus]OKL58779.1 hypothetical protein UA08_05551 [Talaromyces atroroseus]